MKWVGGAVLRSPIEGASSFAEGFAAGGLRDEKGRSLRQLDLQTRLLKNPCSYLVGSDSFDGLPGQVKHYVYRRLWQVLKNKDPTKRFSYWSAGEREARLGLF